MIRETQLLEVRALSREWNAITDPVLQLPTASIQEEALSDA